MSQFGENGVVDNSYVFSVAMQMYEEALLTNERLKTRLEGSKQELVMMQTQLERANQVLLPQYYQLASIHTHII